MAEFPQVEAVTYEVIKNKLLAIQNDQALAIIKASGSPIITEAFDFNNGIFLPDGTALGIGMRYLCQAYALTRLVQATVKECGDNPGINPGDQFICNDPWKGVTHQQDQGIIAPVFYKGELVAWVGALTHQIDVGGQNPGSWCPQATEIFHEGIPIPPVKLVENEKLRKDIWDMILAHSRLPFLAGLDLKALIAGNNVAIRTTIELLDRYGAGTVKAVMGSMTRVAERQLREFLKEIPDGVYRAVCFHEHDGHENRLYKFVCTGTKQGDGLTLDFTGSSPQAPGFINLTEAATMGAVGSGIMAAAGFAFDWNGGLYKPVRVILPEGSICNAKYPAPVSGCTFTQFTVSEVVSRVVWRMLACTDKYAKEVGTGTTCCHSSVVVAGINQYGERYGTLLMDACMGGEGGWRLRDGHNGCRGGGPVPLQIIADTETNENFAPILYLYKRLEPDTEGAGRRRSGVSGNFAFTLHDAGFTQAVLTGHGRETPREGIMGGLPGGCSTNIIVEGSDIEEQFRGGHAITQTDRLNGKKRDLGPKGVFPLLPGTVAEFVQNAGGGYGDPLEREPERVLQDVIDGHVTVEWAKRTYGVIIDAETLQLDVERTGKERKGTLKKRLDQAVPAPQAGQIDAAKAVRLAPIGEYLELIKADGQKIIRCRCGYQFGPPTRNPKDFSAKAVAKPEELGRQVKLHEDLEARLYFCPRCGVQWCAEVARKEDAPLWEVGLAI